MALDVADITARLKRVTSTTPPPVPGWSAPTAPPPPAERPWLTAEAYVPPEGSEAEHASPSPTPRRVSGRGPRRRRWTMPGSPAERNAEPVDPPAPELHVCPYCKQRHQPVAMHGGGTADAYSRSLFPDPTRPDPIGRGPADESSLIRDGFNPWRGRLIEEPPGSPLTMRDRLAALWQGDQEPNRR